MFPTLRLPSLGFRGFPAVALLAVLREIQPRNLVILAHPQADGGSTQPAERRQPAMLVQGPAKCLLVPE